MRLLDAEKFVNACIDKTYNIWGKSINLRSLGWKFGGFDRASRRGGVCRGYRKEIGLSKKLTELRTDKNTKNTILHEIAHALDFAYRGISNHDRVWKAIAIEIGCSGERCFSLSEELSNSSVSVAKKIYKYLDICPVHGEIGGWTRKPKDGKRICKKCKSEIKIKQV